MRKRKPLESTIENAVVDYAKAPPRNCIVRKMNGLGFRSWPDRLFITPKGRHFYIEFKRDGEVPTAGQDDFIEGLVARGVDAVWCDNAADGKHYVDEMCGTLPREEY